MWAEYFVNGSITGCDNRAERVDGVRGERTECYLLDQRSKKALAEFRNGINGIMGFDIIVDDASHVMKDQQITLAAFFPLLNPGGLYVIEDLHTSTGESERCFEDFGLERDLSNSTIRMLEAFLESKKIVSSYFDDEETRYLNENIESCELFNPKSWSTTSMIKKRKNNYGKQREKKKRKKETREANASGKEKKKKRKEERQINEYR